MPKKIFEEMGEVNGKMLYSVRFEQTEEEKTAEKAKEEEQEKKLHRMSDALNKMKDLLDKKD